jgi:hypothetical protein
MKSYHSLDKFILSSSNQKLNSNSGFELIFYHFFLFIISNLTIEYLFFLIIRNVKIHVIYQIKHNLFKKIKNFISF